MNNKKILEAELEGLWHEGCMEMWGDRCAVCNGQANTFHHFVPRSRSLRLKYDVMNGVPVCQKCHSILHYITKNPLDVYRAVETIKQKRGQEWVDYIEKAKEEKGNFRSIKFLTEQRNKIKDYLNY